MEGNEIKVGSTGAMSPERELHFYESILGEDDDAFVIVKLRERIPRDLFVECLRNGAVRKKETDYGAWAWAWNISKARSILERAGYRIVLDMRPRDEEREADAFIQKMRQSFWGASDD
jgi:hypothetical protein